MVSRETYTLIRRAKLGVARVATPNCQSVAVLPLYLGPPHPKRSR